MAIIKFKITRLPKRAILKVDAVPMVLGQEYTIPQQAQMTCDVSDLGVPYDDFGYKLGNDKNIWSAEYKCTVNANVDTGAFIITNEVFDVTINNTTAIPITLEDQVDRITIVSHSPKYGELLINGSQAILGKTYMRYNYFNLQFSSNANLDTQNIESILSYTKGNKNGTSSACTYTFKTTANLSGSINGIATT